MEAVSWRKERDQVSVSLHNPKVTPHPPFYLVLSENGGGARVTRENRFQESTPGGDIPVAHVAGPLEAGLQTPVADASLGMSVPVRKVM